MLKHFVIIMSSAAKLLTHLAKSAILLPKRLIYTHLDSKVHGANMGPFWGRQDPGGPHVGPMNLAFWAE